MNNLIVFLFAGMLSLVFADLHYDPRALVEICDSEIYCHGDLLNTVQMAQIFPDSKTFVDLKLKMAPQKTMEKFRRWKKVHQNPTKDEIAAFVKDSFDPNGSEYQKWLPDDYVTDPDFLSKINDPRLRQIGKSVNALWPEMGRKMTDDVAKFPHLYSIIHLNHPMIVPGGRFNEYYYWDSYWIIKGLLVSQMTDTAKGMLQNFGALVKRYGFIPNGGRIYYLGRSQPPLYIPMMHDYFLKTRDIQFIKNNIEFMETEFNYWIEKQTLEVHGHRLAAYGESTSGPRPEAYVEDMASVANLTTSQKQRHFSQIKAAAESGMAFSSRWFIRDKTNLGSMNDLKCRSIVPVDLNAILFKNAELLSNFCMLLGQHEKRTHYEKLAEKMKKAITAVFWDEQEGIWLDYDLENNMRRNYFAASNLVPLWANVYDKSKNVEISAKVIKYMAKHRLLDYRGGVPFTLLHSSEQWDFPNAFPPMMHFLVDGLENLSTQEASQLAFDVASDWIRANSIGFLETNYMFEKYDANQAGKYGEGGEYTVQTGYGWTNGVFLDFLNRYGHKMTNRG